MSFSDNPHTVFLDDFGFVAGDRFTYTYNFLTTGSMIFVLKRLMWLRMLAPILLFA
jgi:hypothetical protein